jgi:hypothetical protein
MNGAHEPSRKARSPLNFATHHDIPANALKILSFFTKENHVLVVDHIRDVATLCGLHQVTQQDISLKLLATSLKGKALIWFRGLSVNSIVTWDDLGAHLNR